MYKQRLWEDDIHSQKLLNDMIEIWFWYISPCYAPPLVGRMGRTIDSEPVCDKSYPEIWTRFLWLNWTVCDNFKCFSGEQMCFWEFSIVNYLSAMQGFCWITFVELVLVDVGREHHLALVCFQTHLFICCKYWLLVFWLPAGSSGISAQDR